jgi:ligand-binding sensor domain-containing protein
MKKLFLLCSLFFSFLFSAQTDYSDSWEDLYSYNNVKDIVKVDEVIYALVDNAIFTYDTATEEINKLSSVQGLSGETTSSMHYNKSFQRLFIGYENGLLEVVDNDGTITISSDIVSFNQSGRKSINHIKEFNNKLYLSTPFGIVVYDIEKLEFGDTYFIGNNSSSLEVYQTEIMDGFIYAATNDGVFKADLTSNLLIDFNNWEQQFFSRNISKITLFNEQLYVVEGTTLYRINGVNLIEEINFTQNITAIKSSNTYLSVAFNSFARILDLELNAVFEVSATSEFEYTLNNIFTENDSVYLATKEYGILKSRLSLPNSYTEIHPEGPLDNDIFSITAQNNTLWVVYGGYDDTNTPINNKKGFSRFNGEQWVNTVFNSSLPSDLVQVTIDPNNENKVYISALGVTSNIDIKPTGGLLVVENDVITQTYNHLNSSFEPIQVSLPSINIRVSGSAFDNQGNLWATNYETGEELKKLSASGQWSSIDLSAIVTNKNKPGLNEVVVDKSNSVWIGTRKNGLYVYNENGNRKKALITTTNSGNLPDVNVRAIAIDASNRVWIGTNLGMVVYNNASGVFDDSTPNGYPVVINGDENGFGERLLGDQKINSIVIDGAENKWFGTDNGGVIYTNPNGQKTLANFSMKNSPLPSDKIKKIAVDRSLGKVYFATDKGMVAYNSNVAPFGDVLAAVYAYPNPALINHQTITIDGRKGTHLPKGTNVKILDVAGNLVYETNVIEGQELQGGKVVWNKKNLAGNPVASGIYIVLLSNEDASETAFTKIAIVN